GRVRARQRRRLRHEVLRQAVRSVPEAAQDGGVRGDGDRPGERTAHHPSPRRPDLGRGRGRTGRRVLFFTADGEGGCVMTELRRILLAEDDPNDVELTLAALGENRLANEVIVVNDGTEVMDYLQIRGRFADRARGNPAVVLLDIKMPKLDGLEVLKRMKQDQALSTIPVVMLTSSREERDLVESYRLGVNAYVVKPVDFQEFVDAVKNLGLFWAVVNQPPPASLRKSA